MTPQDPRPAVPPAQPQSRGCAVAGVVALALAAVLLVAGGVWFVLNRESLESGDFDAAPECAVGETGALAASVPSHILEIEEPVGGQQDTFGSGWQCRWATPEGPGEAVPSFATLVMVAAPNPGGIETAAENLRNTTANQETTAVDGIGDEAVSWTDESDFPFACVASRVSNLYVETCYGAAADYGVTRAAEAERGLATAEELARAVIAELPT
ncbi:hypothetical protein [Nocardiopsis sp. FIRDI 009]|uniref:hypothetical protein n=1 Tax=Nocardiopsis sp. FIRDI 009 TaxID=714197 RepID=UPI000E2317EF|nr:hypothetical protein [Nocardiopsis sp. FIRDI 009]